jgi:two-component system response regulator AtoC
MNILIVDDEADYQNYLKKMLSPAGYGVESVSRPFTALDILCRQYFDVVITDYTMPQMNGIELMLKIKKINSDIRVIILTASEIMASSLKNVNDNAYSFFRKPVDFYELMKILKIIENELPGRPAREK